MASNVAEGVAELKEELIATRRDLHRHPETAFQERRTSELVAARLESFGYHVQRGIAETGVVGLLEGDEAGPTVMIRADIDALPIQEPEDRPYSSLSPGKMHACGHDGHTSVGLAVAELLSHHRQAMKGNVKLVFQPAEEIIAGAKRMLDEGVMKDPKVDRVLSFHMWPSLPVGKVVAQAGTIFSSVDEIRIDVKGRGGHGGLPHLSVDPIVIASHVVLALQDVLSREVAPDQAAVLGFGIIRGGSQFNIVAEEVELTGNIRTFDETNRSFMLQRVQEISTAVAGGLRGEAVFHHVKGSPSVVNDAEVAKIVAEVAAGVVGGENVVAIPPATVGDDAAYFLNEAPGCYFLMGCANSQRGIVAPLHSPDFDIDEEVLPLATRILTEATLRFLT